MREINQQMSQSFSSPVINTAAVKNLDNQIEEQMESPL